MKSKISTRGIASLNPQAITKVDSYPATHCGAPIVVAALLVAVFLLIYVACAYGTKIDPFCVAIGMVMAR